MIPKGTTEGRTLPATNVLLLMVAGAMAMPTMAEQFWWLAPSVGTIAAVLVIWFNWGQHKVRILRLRKPFRLDMISVVDGNETFVKELHAPPDTDFSIQFRLWPKLKYQHHEIVFGFLGDPQHRPIPKSAFNEFIKIGTRRNQSPNNNENHSIDRNDHYHVREDKHLSPPNNYSYGFLVQTREPGVYPIRFEVITDSGEARPINGVFLTVRAREARG